jgi:ribosomal protein L22
MTKKYDLKLNPLFKKIVDINNEIDPMNRYGTASAYLKPVIVEEINKILDKFNSERKDNPELQKILERKENREILDLLEKNLHF